VSAIVSDRPKPKTLENLRQAARAALVEFEEYEKQREGLWWKLRSAQDELHEALEVFLARAGAHFKMDIENPEIDPRELFRITAEVAKKLGCEPTAAQLQAEQAERAPGFPDRPALGGKSAVVMFRLLSVLRAAALTELEAKCALNAALAVLPNYQTR
jgi:hypothetical protein